MIIKDSCKDWEMLYNNAALVDIDPETQEFRIIKSILHLAGDIVSAYNRLPKDFGSELKEAVLADLAIILTETKNQIVTDFDHAMSLHTFSIPLEKGYSEEEIFGIKLKEAVEAVLKSDIDVAIAAEHYHALSKPGGVEDDDDELN